MIVVACGSDDFGVLVDVGSDPREIGGFDFWWLFVTVELTDVFDVLDVGIFVYPVGTFPLLFGTLV